MPAPSDILQFMRGQLFQTPALPATRFDGQTVVITGANSGLGLEAAKQTFKLGASTLILGCRSLERGEAAKAVILGSARGKQDIQVWQLDMNEYASVKAFAARLNQLSRIDAVLLNAGISTNEFRPAEGSEATLVTNVISTFLLARLCLPVLKRSAQATRQPSHLTIVGSNVHCFADPRELIDPPTGELFATMGDPKQANMAARYFLSKLMVMMGVRQLAATIERGQVIVNGPSPGWCKTPLFRQDDGGFMGRNMLRLIGRTPEIGARCLTSALVAGPETHGEYLSECQVKDRSVWLRSQEGQEVERKVWKELLDVLHGISPELSHT